MKKKEIDKIIEAALREDLPKGDITSESIIHPDSESEAAILARERGVLAGIEVAGRVFEKIDASISFNKIFRDGQMFKKNDALATLQGNSISLLKGERTALNFLQRLSGIATFTHKFVQALEGTKTKVLDTRKTTPGLRVLEKYAVRIGGGINHRMNLSEMVLIKDNHLRLVNSISDAIREARKRSKTGIKIEVEVSDLDEAKEAICCGADVIMLDNMTKEKMKEIVKWVGGRIPLEVSGKVNLKGVKEIASLGVDFISIGGLTHSYKSVDMSMEFLR